ncbi:ribonuclease III domain-containing protein [Serpentinicella sp. ANB-PHB4]|uniref:Mini-ribonuclease 3 n=1 Tax=Serpentinicella sp. ANB-PHB4 TaxID=3074076 RepID=UPI0028600248|nr:ribonuclease III domain-containing protein [Serpentinicella sp. ANB-PHB4]MDR5659928.1 ribonuclease III domain-containing protein [Serpentinicella sp. ANB-PHB4]
MKELLETIIKTRDEKSESEVKMMSPLVLAYVGDAIFEVHVRNYLIARNNVSVHQLHKLATTYVKAKAQSKIISELDQRLKDEERAIVRRGRNQKTGTTPKNADIMDYKYATGFEALIGYLFYIGDMDRLREILELSTEIIRAEQ